MEPLYKTTMDFTYEEFKKFNNAVLRANLLRLWPLFLALILLFFAALFLDPGIIVGMRYFLLFFVFLIIATLVINRLSVKKLYKNSLIPENSPVEISFYADHLNSVTVAGNAMMYYDKVARIIETDTNFYVMTPQNQGFLVVKANCSPELIVFLRELAAERKAAKKKK